ncbi:unnamed protein product [Chironomus riparius]|uniref:Uncharacterized protein n=1 Tax=Chironomus riparius TaxID=315576 RepID=A0A9N9RX38_9DIPT|nr:unnamed protein product [Chironomus riparius]
MESILNLLFQHDATSCSKKILKNASKNWKETDMMIFQYFIDVFGKEFTFTEEHYDQIKESTIDFEDLMTQIYEERDSDEDMSEQVGKMKQFINLLLNELFVADLLDDLVISNWITFLASATEHPNIPKESKMKGNAYLLLTCMLYPLTKLLACSSNPLMELTDETRTAVSRSIERIMNNISSAFEYEKYFLICAKEYTETLTQFHEQLLSNSMYLNHFRAMLIYDQRQILALAINSIAELCKIASLDEVMKNFLFTTINNQENIVNIIIKLINYKNLRLEVIGCLKEIGKFKEEHQILTTNNKIEVFLNVFSKSPKTVSETAALMVELGYDFWKELIYMLNYCTDDDMDLKLILTSIQPVIEVNQESILKFITENIKEPVISSRAAEIFNATLELCEMNNETLESLINTMNLCRSDETTFVMLLQTLIAIDDEMLVAFLKEDVNYLTQQLMPMISNAFLDFNKPITLSLIVRALRKLYRIEPLTMLLRVRDIFNGLFKILLSLENVEFTEREKFVPKISAILECKSWRILNENSMTDLYTFCQKFCTNRSYNHFPQFQRFYVNVIKHFWMLLVSNKPLLIDEDKFIKETRNIQLQIMAALKSTKNSIPDNCLLLCSQIDLHVLFQPRILEKVKNQFFEKFTIPLSKEDFIQLVDAVESNLFPEIEDASFYQQMLMQNFVMLYKNFINLPSTTSWEAFLRHYNHKSSYKAEIEIIMTHAIGMKKTIFEKSVAFAILNIAAMNSMDAFKSFFHAFDEFMRTMYSDYKERNVSYGLICSIILERFSRSINDENADDMNRLSVLDCVALIIKNSDQSFSKNLGKFLRVNEVALTITELEKLNNFKRLINENGTE